MVEYFRFCYVFSPQQSTSGIVFWLLSFRLSMFTCVYAYYYATQMYNLSRLMQSSASVCIVLVIML